MRVKTSPKTGATGERNGCTDKKGGGKFDPSRCGGHKNSENAATFSELLGQEDKLSPALPGIEHGARPVKDTTETRLISESGERFYAEGLNSKKLRGATGKRYDRGLTGEAGHGVPGVLLPSQPRSGNIDERKREAKTAPRTHNSQARIQAKQPITSVHHTIGRVIPSPEGDNVRHKSTTRKNAQQ